jgi:hypothetical protein
MKKLTVILSILILSSLISSISFAQVSLGISPLFTDKVMYPGQTQKFQIFVSTEGDPNSTIKFRAYAAPVMLEKNGTFRLLEKGEGNPWDCSGWIKNSTSEITLKGGESKPIDFTITVPRGISGSRYAGVIFEVLPEKTPSTEEAVAKLNISYQMIGIVNVTVPGGKVEKKALISNLDVSTTKENLLSFTASIKNLGNISLTSRGRLLIKSRLGRRIKEIPLGGGMGLLLPGAELNFRSLIRLLPEGEYIAEITFSYGGPRPIKMSIPFVISGKEAKIGSLASERGIDFVVEPSIQEVSAPAGSFRSSVIMVQNPEREPLKVKVSITPISLTPEGDIEIQQESKFSCTEWIKVEPEEFNLMPQERKAIKVSLNAPKTISSGGRYANISFEAKKTNGNSELTVSSGTTYLITVPGNLKLSGEVQDIQFIRPQDSSSPYFLALFRNTGNIHLKASATLTIKKKEKDSNKTITEELPFSDGEVIVLPDGSRQFMLLYTQTLEPGEYIASVKVNYGEKRWATLEKDFKIEVQKPKEEGKE